MTSIFDLSIIIFSVEESEGGKAIICHLHKFGAKRAVTYNFGGEYQSKYLSGCHHNVSAKNIMRSTLKLNFLKLNIYAATLNLQPCLYWCWGNHFVKKIEHFCMSIFKASSYQFHIKKVFLTYRIPKDEIFF